MVAIGNGLLYPVLTFTLISFLCRLTEIMSSYTISFEMFFKYINLTTEYSGGKNKLPKYTHSEQKFDLEACSLVVQIRITI